MTDMLTGHLEGGSGLPSIVKTILSLERGIIPRLANFRQLHPQIAVEHYPFAVGLPALRRGS
jgi:acyl transferase domain-containing protein